MWASTVRLSDRFQIGPIRGDAMLSIRAKNETERMAGAMIIQVD